MHHMNVISHMYDLFLIALPLSSHAKILYTSEKVREGDGMAQDATKDFFISYNKADRAWAECVAWQLEGEGREWGREDPSWSVLPGKTAFHLTREPSTSCKYAPDAIIYSLLRDEPALYMLGRCEQKGCWV
jgi:hypothetical protein